jgi:hypothetical protein
MRNPRKKDRALQAAHCNIVQNKSEILLKVKTKTIPII